VAQQEDNRDNRDMFVIRDQIATEMWGHDELYLSHSREN